MEITELVFQLYSRKAKKGLFLRGCIVAMLTY